jgi:hypothetical protein
MGTESLTARHKRSRSSLGSLRITSRESELRSPRQWSIALKTTAIITALTVVGSFGFTMSQGSFTNQTGVDTAISGDHTDQAPQPVTPAIQVATATCRPPSAWFSATPKFFVPCDPESPRWLGVQWLMSADVNSDGTRESFDFATTYTQVLANGSLVTPTPSDFKVVQTITARDSTGIRIDEEVVFQVDVVAVGTAILQRFPDIQGNLSLSIGSSRSGWHDCDHDGDLDLVVSSLGGSLPDGSRQVWFENIGYEKPAQPVAADLNRDGRVDGADLGMLLIAWGPTN